VLAHESAASTSTYTGSPAAASFTFPFARSVSRSSTFSTAVAAVGVQTPEVQLMFDVPAEEMVTAAWATGIAQSMIPAEHARSRRGPG
jgi:hypothetical protein